jgi:hypothetical protein
MTTQSNAATLQPCPLQPGVMCEVRAPREASFLEPFMTAGTLPVGPGLAITIVVSVLAATAVGCAFRFFRGGQAELAAARKKLADQRAATDRMLHPTVPQPSSAQLVDMVRRESARKFRPVADLRHTQPMELK